MAYFRGTPDSGPTVLRVLLVLIMASAVVSTAVTEHTHKLARANNAFAIHLYQALQATNKGENLFFSPLSISTALAMTHLGARGTSSAQIGKVLRFNQLEESRLHESLQELNSLLYKSSNKYTLRAANKLYGKTGSTILQEFLDSTANFYESVFESVADFTSPDAAQRINNWVSQQTEGRITDLISPGMLDSHTRLILVNAIYFKGNWAKRFHAEVTQPGVFKMTQETVNLRMMIQGGKFQLTDDKTRECFVVEIPYEGNDLSMLAVLPWHDDGLASVEAQLSQEVLDFWDSDLEEEKVQLRFPKFKLEEQLNLSSILLSMGMIDPFISGKANFEGISGDKSLYISEVIHKAFVEINEEGTEAAAATAVMIGQYSGSFPGPYRLNFDHPFLFLIRDRRTNAVLFMGRMLNPPRSSRVNHDEL